MTIHSHPSQVKSIYLGNDLSNQQLLIAIPFLDSFCRSKGITSIVLQRPLDQSIRSNPYITRILDAYELHLLPSSRDPSKRFLFNLILRYFLQSFVLAFFSSRRFLCSSSSWYVTQLRHAVFDSSLQSIRDGSLSIPFFTRFRFAVLVLSARSRLRQSIRKHNIVSALLGHSVYTGRAILAELRLSGADILAHAAGSFYRTFPLEDNGWSLLSPKEFQYLWHSLPDSLLNSFWSQRKRGISSYEDAQLASLATQKPSKSYPNILFLHVFRDSPFYIIDRTRIFSDYVEWILFTLRAIKYSSEPWLIKLHPSANRWGEDQTLWIQSLFSASGITKHDHHIHVDDLQFSNIDLLVNAKRVVTFHGTVHVEAAAHGIRPIVLNSSALGSACPQSVLKPTSRDHYRNLLLAPSCSPLFNLSPRARESAIGLLYLREHVLTFDEPLGLTMAYRTDSSEKSNAGFASVEKLLPLNLSYLSEAGALVADGANRTLSPCFHELAPGLVDL